MIESKKTIALLLAIAGSLAVMLGVLALLPQASAYDVQQDEISIFSYPTSEVTRIDILNNGQTYTMLQDDTGWRLQGGAKLDYASADLLVTFLAYLYSDNLVEERAIDLRIYGLDTPDKTAVFYLSDQSSHKVAFGNETVNGKSVYMRVDDEDAVYTMPLEAYEIIFSAVPEAEETAGGV